jgi:hypothetical protein
MIRHALLGAVLLLATPALAQRPLGEVLSRLGQGELTAGDGPSYRAVVGGSEVFSLQVAGDGRATLTATDKTGKKETRFVSNRQLDALDAALGAAPFGGAAPAQCKPESGIIFETLIDGRYQSAVECGGGPLAKAVEILRGS